MIDIHNHIIYDVDDGAENIEESIKIIKSAKDVGITDICFTPHYMEDGYKTERKELEVRLESIRKCLKNENIKINLFLGEEIFIFPKLVENIDKIVSLNDSRYILIEFPLVEEISYIDEVLYKLLAMGKVPIIAHPERYLTTQRDLSFAKNLVEKGALLQININSISGHYGKEAKKIATDLLKLKMVQFIASDSHSTAGYSVVPKSMEILRKIISEEEIKELTEDNPMKVLKNEDIDVDIKKLRNINIHKDESFFDKWFMNLAKKREDKKCAKK